MIAFVEFKLRSDVWLVVDITGRPIWPVGEYSDFNIGGLVLRSTVDWAEPNRILHQRFGNTWTVTLFDSIDEFISKHFEVML